MERLSPRVAATFIFSLLLIISALFVSPETSDSKRKLSVSPGVFEFSAPAGAEVSNSFEVQNEGDEAISHVFVYATNVRIGKNLSEQYMLPEPDEPLLSSPASWIYIKVPDPTKIIGNFPFVDLDIGEKKRVDFILKIPEQAPPGDYTIIVFFEARKPKVEQKLAASISARIGCRIKIRVQGEIIEGVQIGSVKLKRFIIGNTVPYEFTLINNGNIDAPGKLSVKLKGLGGRTFLNQTIQRRVYLYSKSRLNYAGVLQKKNPGFGVRIFEVDFNYTDWRGEQKTLTKAVSFFAIPFYIFYFFLALFAILTLFVSFYLDTKLKKKGKAFQQKT